MSKLSRKGTAEPVSRDQILRRANGDREILFFPVQLTTSGNDNLTRLILTLAICEDHMPVASVAQRYPCNLLTRWDGSSIPANGIFLTKKLKTKIKMPNGWKTIRLNR